MFMYGLVLLVGLGVAAKKKPKDQCGLWASGGFNFSVASNLDLRFCEVVRYTDEVEGGELWTTTPFGACDTDAFDSLELDSAEYYKIPWRYNTRDLSVFHTHRAFMETRLLSTDDTDVEMVFFGMSYVTGAILPFEEFTVAMDVVYVWKKGTPVFILEMDEWSVEEDDENEDDDDENKHGGNKHGDERCYIMASSASEYPMERLQNEWDDVTAVPSGWFKHQTLAEERIFYKSVDNQTTFVKDQLNNNYVLLEDCFKVLFN